MASLYKLLDLKKTLVFVFLLLSFASRAQKIDSIYVNLYTDSLKKGTYNYINVDGLLSNGKYIPLDSTYIHFSSNYGKFLGNNLWIDPEPYKGEIIIHVFLKKDPSIQKRFSLFIKTKEDEPLKSSNELLGTKKQSSQKNKK